MSSEYCGIDLDYGRSRPGTPRSKSTSEADIGPNDISSALSPDHLEMLELCRSWKAELQVSDSALDVAPSATESFLEHAPDEQVHVFDTFKNAGKTLNSSPEPGPQSNPLTDSPRTTRISSPSGSGPAPMPSPTWSPTTSTNSSFHSPSSCPSSPRSPRCPLTPEQQQREALQLRQAEIELELSPTGKEQLVACQVSPTSWLHITQRAADEFQNVNNIVKDTRQLVQQQAAFDIERHRHQVAAHLEDKAGMVSFMHLLEFSEKAWREPICSLAKEALESLVNSQYIEGVTLMLLRAACYTRRRDTQRAAIRLLVSTSVSSNSSNGQHAHLAHRALVRAAKKSEDIASMIAEQLVRVHLDTGHAHYVLLLEQLCTETATVPGSAHKFLEALEATHQTYSEQCTDGSSDNYLDYHDVQTALCAASLAYITGAGSAK